MTDIIVHDNIKINTDINIIRKYIKMKSGIKFVIRLLLIVFGVALIIDGLVFTVISNFTVGIILVLLLGAMLASAGIWYEDIHHMTRHGIIRIVKYIVAVGTAFVLGMCVFIAIYGNTDTADGTESVIMVLGCGVNGTVPTQPLAARLDIALSAYSLNPEAYILVSGGQGPQEDISEAKAMEKYLAERGVDLSKIIKEDRSSSTSENYKYSKEILDRRFSEYTVAIITNDFHIYRAKRLAQLAGLEVTAIHAKTPLTSAPMMYLREVLAILKLWILKY